MVKAVDFSKFRKSLTKSIDGVAVGFHDPSTWIDTGNYCLNYLVSGKFNRGVPLGQVTMLAGQSGAGKSLVAANIMKNAQDQGIFVVALDSENGLTQEWLTKAGVDISAEKFLRIQVAQIDAVAQTIHQFMDDYKAQYKDVDPEDRLKVLFVVDSLGMLITKTDMDQFEKGDMKGDMGRKPKALNALVRNCVVQFAEWDVGLVATNHSYASQDMFDPEDKISGGQAFIYASSIVVAMRKAKLKENEAGQKITDVTGIRALVKVMKSRYNKPFESVEIKIPWEKGIDPYSGLVDFFEKQGQLEKEGNKLKYTDLDGNSEKYFRKDIPHALLDKMMEEWPAKLKQQMADAYHAEETEEQENDQEGDTRNDEYGESASS
jgi:recombination protein RecA